LVGRPLLASHGEVEPGDAVGEFRITGVLGESVIGTLYGAIRESDEATVALRVLSTESSTDKNAVTRFIDTARGANRYDPRAIANVLDSGRLADGRAWLASALPEGSTLAQLLAEHALEPPELCAVMRGLCRALDAAHERGVVHGDLQATSVCVSSDGEGRLRASLMELGCHAVLGSARTTSGRVAKPNAGKLLPADAARDIHALGRLCFEALTGARIEGDDELLQTSVSDQRPELGPRFDEPVRAMLNRAALPDSAGAAFLRIVEAARAAGYEVDGAIPAPPRRSSYAPAPFDVLHDPEFAVSIAPRACESDAPLGVPPRRSRVGVVLLVLALAALLFAALRLLG
jgi:serine/threonine-protein kinase